MSERERERERERELERDRQRQRRKVLSLTNVMDDLSMSEQSICM